MRQASSSVAWRMPSLMKNSRHVGGGGGSSWYAPMVRSSPLPLLYQYSVWATSGGVSSRGRRVRETNASRVLDERRREQTARSDQKTTS